MAGGCIDLFTSRRSLHQECKYWKVDIEDSDWEELTYKRKPDGIFYAKEVSPQTLQNGSIAGTYLYDDKSITLFTKDAVDLKQGDLVLYCDEKWKVQSVQSSPIRKQSQFLKETSKITYIQLHS